MATLSRLTGKVFAGDANLTDLGVFGSAKDQNPTNPTGTNTEEQIQADTAYEKGWTEAVITTKNFPPIEEVNGVLRTISYQACYLLQEGVPTYDLDTNYSATSIVKSITNNILTFYLSQHDGNKGNSLSDTNHWKPATFEGAGRIGDPQFTLDFSANGIPDGCIELKGQPVSRTSYNNLFAIYGTTYGAGDGSTTFNLPDFSNRTIYGGTSAGLIEAGLPDLDLSIGQGGIHNHGASSTSAPAHTHNYQKTSSSRAYGDGNPSDSEKKYFLTSISNSSTATSSAGGFTPIITINNSTSHNHPLIVGANSIVGTADSVYSNGIKVRVYTRYI